MGLKRAFELLISEQYRLYILTVGCIVVSISYCAHDGHFKCLTHMLEIFMAKVTLEGCGLLDISFTDDLVHHFQSLFI